MSVTGTPLDNKHLRMSMAGSHSTRATRKEYESTKSLYGIPEESGWSIPMPAIQAERARKNVLAVYYTCIEDHADTPEITNTPEVAFAEDYGSNGSYFDRSATSMSDAIQADGSMGELVMKLDSLDDFFDDGNTTTPGREGSRGSVEDRENIYEQQTLPILHKSLKRNASVTSFERQHFGHFPRSLGQILQHAKTKELHLRFSTGRWDAESWGTRPWDGAKEGGTGVEIWAWVEADTDDEYANGALPVDSRADLKQSL